MFVTIYLNCAQYVRFNDAVSNKLRRDNIETQTYTSINIKVSSFVHLLIASF